MLVLNRWPKPCQTWMWANLFLRQFESHQDCRVTSNTKTLSKVLGRADSEKFWSAQERESPSLQAFLTLDPQALASMTTYKSTTCRVLNHSSRLTTSSRSQNHSISSPNTSTWQNSMRHQPTISSRCYKTRVYYGKTLPKISTIWKRRQEWTWRMWSKPMVQTEVLIALVVEKKLTQKPCNKLSATRLYYVVLHAAAPSSLTSYSLERVSLKNSWWH